MARIKGGDKFRRIMQALVKSTAKEGTAALYALGNAIEIRAEISITEGSISGKGHVPSLPGEPPNADTRALDTAIETVLVDGPEGGRVDVESNAPHAAYMEFGTSRIAERPYMRPATEAERPNAAPYVAESIRGVIRRTR